MCSSLMSGISGPPEKARKLCDGESGERANVSAAGDAADGRKTEEFGVAFPVKEGRARFHVALAARFRI